MLSIGIKYSEAGAIIFKVGGITISMSGLATAAVVGIVLNAILPEKDYEFNEDVPDNTGVNFEVGQNH